MNKERISGSLFIRENGPMALGQICPNHKHNFGHTTVVLYGAFRLVAYAPDGHRYETFLKSPRPGCTAPYRQFIPAGWYHEFIAEEEGSMFGCFYSHRNPQGNVIPEYAGFDAAYGTWLSDKHPNGDQ